MYRICFAITLAVVFAASAPAKAAAAEGMAADVPHFVQRAMVLGPAAAHQKMYLVVHLKYPNPSAVDAFVRVVHDPASPEYRHFLSPAQFDAAFSPTATTYALVLRALTRAGFQIYRTYPNRKVIDVISDVTTVESYFNTLIERYGYFGKTFYANTVPARMPAELRGAVLSVCGFNDHDRLLSDLRMSLAPRSFGTQTARRPSGFTRLLAQSTGPNPAPSGQFGPREIQIGYDYPEVSNAAIDGNGSKGRATIAIETAFDYSDNDLQDYWTMFNVSRSLTPGAGQPYVYRKIVDCPTCGGQGVPAPDENVETTVDVQQSSSNAPGANVLVYEGTDNLLTTFDDIYAQVVQDPRVDVVTTSWGICESDENTNEHRDGPRG
jgi:kumamolisin